MTDTTARIRAKGCAQADGQAAIDDTLTPPLKDAIAAGAQHSAHPFLPTDAADELGSCEVCGLGESAAPHRAYQVAQQADPFTTTDDQEPVDEEEPALT